MGGVPANMFQPRPSHFDPAKFDDRYETALIELLRRKQEGKRIEPIREAPQPSNVVNLMDALRKSVQTEAGSSPAPGRTAAGGRRRYTAAIQKRTGRRR